ncbi:MAG TPA: AMP-binding protein [Gemmataceae bacterium]|jgi:phenylacetate-CoA ligase|nr:AMP-binding protein [Gemmataceae bacterium]
MFTDRRQLREFQESRLRSVLTSLLPANRFYAEKFARLDLAKVQLTGLPFTTKAELLADQERHPPYGRMLSLPLPQYSRMCQTSGTTTGRPLCWLDTPESWDAMLGCWEQIFRLIGMREEDRLFFPFSFGPFLGFWTAFDHATRAGYFTLPGGGMSSSARLRFLKEHRVTVVFCTPTYALHLAEVAATDGIDLPASGVRMLIVAGEPGGSIPETRRRIEAAWGARVIDHSGMTEIGPMAVECWQAPGGLHVLESDYLVEVIDPAIGKEVPAGQIGELVVTNLNRTGSPLLRYRTGDLAQLDFQPCVCGSIFARLQGGILGRVDDMIHLRGNNVYPAAIENLLRKFPEVAEYRLVVEETGALSNLRIEIEPMPSASGAILVDRITKLVRDELLFRAEVVCVSPGSLPRYEMKAQRLIHNRGPASRAQ